MESQQKKGVMRPEDTGGRKAFCLQKRLGIRTKGVTFSQGFCSDSGWEKKRKNHEGESVSMEKFDPISKNVVQKKKRAQTAAEDNFLGVLQLDQGGGAGRGTPLDAGGRL